MLLLAPVMLCGTYGGVVRAAGLSAYLPLNLEPEMERQIERVLILADEPILKRPIPVELVKLALPQACLLDKYLCKKVGRYLERYSRDYALTHASATAAFTHGAKNVALPDAYGMESDSHYEFSAQGFVQPSDYLLASAGVISYKGRTQPTGTALSLGFDWAQIDVGYRDHWMSPMTDSSMIMSTEAPTTPSVTLSNYAPLTRFGFQYEFFLTKLDQTGSGSATGDLLSTAGLDPNAGNVPAGDNILYDGVYGRGNPAPVRRPVLDRAFSRVVARHQPIARVRRRERPAFDSARFLLRDFFQPSGSSQTQGNQQASYVSRFVFPGKTPFAVYAQYGGEDNSNGGSYLLGNAALAVGIDFPQNLAPLRRHLRNHRMAEHLVRAQRLSRRHDEQRVRSRQLGRRSAPFNDGVGARTADAAHRLDAAIRRLPAGAGSHPRE